MIKLNSPITTHFNGYYSSKYKKGFIVEIDKIDFDLSYASKIKCRVINMGKTKKWIDSGWFDFCKKKRNKK